jgi:diacylglycerol kinase family enzyme
MKVFIIANPAAGRHRGAELAQAIRAALAPRVDSVNFAVTSAPGEGERIARGLAVDCVVSVGGDGSANEVLNGLDGRPTSLAIYPAGTANVIARELGIGRGIAAFANLVATRNTRRVDGGEVNGRKFLLGIGAGLDAAVARRLAAVKNGGQGLRRWIKPAMQTVLHFNHAPIRVEVDGEIVTETSTYTVVGNCRYSAGVFPTTRLADVADGLLDVCAMHRLSVPKLAWLAAAVWSPGFPRRRDVVYRQGRAIVLAPASDLPVALQVDGEPAGFLPAKCRVLPASVDVIAPA